MSVYVPTDWVDGSTPVNAANLDKLEAGVANAVQKPAGTVAGEFPVWDGTGWVRSTSGLVKVADAGVLFNDVNLYWGGAGLLKTDGRLEIVGVAGSPGLFISGNPSPVIRSNTAGVIWNNRLAAADAQPSFKVTGDGRIDWGAGGALAQDTNLYRAAANQLKTDDTFWAGGAAGGVILGWNRTAVGRAISFIDDAGVAWDTNLYRVAAAALKTDGSFDATVLKLAGVDIATIFQTRSEEGQPNGYASLDANGKVPNGQLPGRLQDYGLELPGNDFDLAVQNGYYYSLPSSLHAPGGSAYYGLHVIGAGNNPAFIYQFAWDAYDPVTGATTTWYRVSEGGTGFGPWVQTWPITAGADLDYEGDFVPATNYVDGDIVVSGGVAYMCVEPTNEAPTAWPGGGGGGGAVTLPPRLETLGRTGLTDANLAVESGWYDIGTPFTNTPMGFNGALLVSAIDTAINQLWFADDLASPVVHYRRKVGAGAWSAWRETLYYESYRNATTAVLRNKLLAADTQPAWHIRGDGRIQWGPGGATALDTNLFRISANRLKTDSSLIVGGALTPEGSFGLPYSYSASLPSSPYDGMIHIYVDSMSSPTYQWMFRYNAGSSSPYKWEFIGGAPLVSDVPTATGAVTSTAFVQIDPGVTVPRAGDYDCRFEACIDTSAAGVYAIAALKFGAAAVVDSDNALVRSAAGAATVSVSRVRRATGLAAGAQVTLYARVTGGSAVYERRTVVVTPVRVS